MIYGPQKSQTGWRLITPAVGQVFDVDEAKAHLRVDTSDEDTEISALIDVATEIVEARGRLLTTQTWEMLIDGFPLSMWEPVRIFKGPVQSVDSIVYVDDSGVSQTWDSADYQVFLTSHPARVLPAFDQLWPITRWQPEAVTIRFTAGYNSSPPTLPVRVTQAMKLLVGHLYENRESVLANPGNATAIELPQGLEWLLTSVFGTARVY